MRLIMSSRASLGLLSDGHVSSSSAEAFGREKEVSTVLFFWDPTSYESSRPPLKPRPGRHQFLLSLSSLQGLPSRLIHLACTNVHINCKLCLDLANRQLY
ncbi:hypothetical protein EJ04DRAFT_257248 [Polyplosphaeria fusca]|uniref:Uncharacterized protein n=1 Tax=Polyplosphaeria fusca TaxID=682080 RepID=A0A9P4V2B0_9PLEO|nr:hypothetical protein EJ04DRAFT_257248 [Polyplosphaeria fusca]